MWKESYRLGIDKIDRQHMALFEMTAGLIATVKKPDIDKHKKECKEAILFLKKYSLEHFADEEEYQRSIQYAGFTVHRQLHQEFTSSVLKHENKMIASDFDVADIRNFIGMLTAWLAYHVADADQKIIEARRPEKTLIECLYTAICYLLKIMTNINKKDLKKKSDVQGDFKGDFAVTTALIGDVPVTVEYVFSNEFAWKLLKMFLFITPESMDSLVCSIVLEIVNTINKNAMSELARASVYCQAETPVMTFEPPFSSVKEFFILDTPIGAMKAGICG